jgi:nucleotidyltransferase substrate binding protein (TIGR01987 family)
MGAFCFYIWGVNDKNANHKERLIQRLESGKSALKVLRRMLDAPDSEAQRMAVVRAFEICLELAWKATQDAFKVLDIEASSGPGGIIRVGSNLGWISEPELWANMLQARNKTTHTYDGAFSDSVIMMVKEFYLPELEEWWEFLSKKTNDLY